MRAAREAAALDVDQLRTAAVAAGQRAEQAVVGHGVLAHHERAGAVAEEDGEAAVPRGAIALVGRDLAAIAGERIPVFPRHEAGVRLGADDEHGRRRAGRDQTIGDLERERHRAALLADVERGHARDAELGAEQTAGAGER